MMRAMGGEVSVHMDAAPDVVWDLVSDVTRIGEFSPETFEARWTRGATGPEVGAHFKGHVKRNGVGPTYWTLCKVTRCEPERLFEFSVGSGSTTVNNWGYRLEPSGSGTTVTEYKFFAAARSMAGPPMSICSMAFFSEAPPATVSSKG